MRPSQIRKVASLSAQALRRWDGQEDEGRAVEIADLALVRLPELGTYHYRDDVSSLPVEEDHPWHVPWMRYVEMHADFGPDVTLLLVSDWKDPRIRPVLRRIAGLARLTAKGYLDSLSWLPDELKEIIAVHALDGGAGPRNTPALYAAMPAVIATEGAWVPRGGLHELVLALARLAEAAGAELRTGEPVERVERGRIFAGRKAYEADFVVSDLDANRLDAMLPSGRASVPKKLTPSGVDVYAVLREPLPPRCRTAPCWCPTTRRSSSPTSSPARSRPRRYFFSITTGPTRCTQTRRAP